MRVLELLCVKPSGGYVGFLSDSVLIKPSGGYICGFFSDSVLSPVVAIYVGF